MSARRVVALLTATLALVAALTVAPAPESAPVAADAPAPVAGSAGDLPGSGGYPRVVRLEHAGAANGTLIETDTDGFLGGTQRFHRSTDGGRTFEALPSLSVTGNIHGTHLFELPTDAGDLPAGTLLFAAAINPSGDYPPDSGDNRMQIPVYRSDDGAQTWTLLSYCVRSDDGSKTGGLWEPELHVADDGRLVCLYSDETDHPAHSQVLSQVISDDGGATWSAPEQVVATPDPIDRPGMATTARLPDGTWVMTHEDCGLRHPPCLAMIRTGPDGIHWGEPSEDSTVIYSTDRARFLSAPTVAWTPDGGPQGTILVVGRILNGGDGYADPNSGATVLASTHGAAGPWTRLVAPVATTPTWDDIPTNYSSPLLPLGNDLLLGFAAQTETDRASVRWGIVALTPQPAPTTTTTTTATTPPATTAVSPSPPSASSAAPVAGNPTYTG